MTNPKDPLKDRGARVLSLDCARTEEALAEDAALDSQSLRHLQDCPPCRELAELIGDRGAIATATQPVALPDGFTDSVLARAFSDMPPLSRIRPATDDLRVAELEAALHARRRRTWWIAGIALAAGIGLALATTLPTPAPNLPTDTSPSATAHPVSSPTDSAAPEQAPTATATPLPRPAKRASQDAPEPPSMPASKAIAPRTVPEPVMDIPAEIRATVLRNVKQQSDCPKTNATPVRVTLTVDSAGNISSPQILSASGNARSHQCVTWAVDRLLLPPLGRSVTVTLDLTW